MDAKLFDVVSDLYEDGASVKEIARKTHLSDQKVRKILITCGLYDTPAVSYVLRMYAQGASVDQIACELCFKRNTVLAMLPYRKGIYNLREPSTNAKRIRRLRARRKREQ